MGGRPGRKRKGDRARYRSGKLKPKPKDIEERVRIARAQPHRRSLRSKDRTSELAESELGRLSLCGEITGGERAAGETFAGVVNAYRAVIEGPRPIRSLMPEIASEREKTAEELIGRKFDCPSQYADPIERRVSIGGRTVTFREWPCQLPGQTCACAERRTRYMRAYEAIMDAGRAAMLEVIRAAIRGEPPLSIVNLKRGLNAAKQHFGLTEVDRGA